MQKTNAGTAGERSARWRPRTETASLDDGTRDRTRAGHGACGGRFARAGAYGALCLDFACGGAKACANLLSWASTRCASAGRRGSKSGRPAAKEGRRDRIFPHCRGHALPCEARRRGGGLLDSAVRAHPLGAAYDFQPFRNRPGRPHGAARPRRGVARGTQ